MKGKYYCKGSAGAKAAAAVYAFAVAMALIAAAAVFPSLGQSVIAFPTPFCDGGKRRLGKVGQGEEREKRKATDGRAGLVCQQHQ